MAATLRVQLLQEFRLWLDDKPVDGLYQPRLQSLLAYLALHPHTPQPRHQIASLFWPDSSEPQAQTNLRKLIHTLRQLLPDPDNLLFLDHRHLGWQEGVRCMVDVAEVEDALDQLKVSENGGGASHSAQVHYNRLHLTHHRNTNLQRVATLYVGELLPACYEEWVLALRRALHERVVNALAEALTQLETQHAYTAGSEYAEHLLRLDPLHERAFHYLILFRALSGNRTAAIRAYHEGAQRLDQELGVSPSQETQALFEQLMQEEVQPAPTPSLVHSNQPPLVGRQGEWQTFVEAWRQMPKHGPHLLLIWGEAGMGKTRLVEEMQQWASLRAGTVIEAQLYGAEGNLPYAPVILWLRNAAIRPTIAKLDALWRTELLRLLPELQQQDPGLPLPAPMIEGWQQNRFYEALARVIAAAPAPRLLILDDLQWCDGETLRWLRYLLRFDPHLPLLVIGTVRSEALDSAHPLHELLHHLRRSGQCSELELHPLDAEATTTLAKSLVEEEQSEWVEQLYQETEGIPLYIVETVRARLTKGIENNRAGGIPSTIQAVIAARLVQLSQPAQQLVEFAATIGRAFSPALLAAAAESDEEGVADGLDELWRRRILVTKNEGYDFSHDKIREVAYSAIAPMQRRRLHGKVAQALEEIFTADLTMVWGQLAIHYEAAQMPEKALSSLIHMAKQAEALDAYGEADGYYARALTLQKSHLPADKRGELDLLLQRTAISERQGQAAGQEVEIEKMLALAGAIGEPELLATTYLRQASYLSSIGDIRAALYAGEEALAIHRANHNKEGEIQALRELGLICWATQAYGDALRYGREVLILHRQQSDISGEATALHNLAEIYRGLGSPRQAIALYEEALQLYWMRRDNRRQALTLYGLAYAYQQSAQVEEALRHYQKARALCEKVGDRLILSRVAHAVAILHWELQQREAALQTINEAVEISRAIHHLPSIAYSLVALGYMEAQLDRRAAAHQHLQGALDSLTLMGDEEGIREVQKRVERLIEGTNEISEPPPTLHWIRSHVVLSEGKVYCEFELPAMIAQGVSREGRRSERKSK